PVEQFGTLARVGPPLGEQGLPFLAGGAAPRHHAPGVLQQLVGHVELRLRVEAQHPLGGGDLFSPQRGAVDRPRVLLVRGRPADDGAQPDERGTFRLRLGGPDRVVRRRHVFVVGAVLADPLDLLDVPAVGGVAGDDVFGECDLGVVFDGDAVVVPDDDEVAELLRAGEGTYFVADALLDVAVRAQDVDVVVERAFPDRGVRVEQAPLPAGGHGHADRVADALPQGAGGGFHPGGVPVFGVARGEAAPLAQLLDVVQAQPDASQVELDVEREAGVPAGQDEAVAADPLRICRIVPHHLLEEQVGHRRQTHRGSRVPGSRFFDRVHRQGTNHVYGTSIEIRPVQGLWGAGVHAG